jgi:ankyrin repeat protein
VDTLPLPPRPSLEQYEKRAKDLVKAARSEDPSATRLWVTEWVGALAGSKGVTITPFVQGSFTRAVEAIERDVRAKLAASDAPGTPFTLADAQLLIARAHAFESWADFIHHVERLSGGDAGGQEFETAVDAVVGGELPALEALVRRHPALIGARSARTHRATLLHYVAANGVEDFRQRTPPNAVAIAKLLLEAGAEVDALANTYGGGTAQTTMNLLVSSTHPARAGLQVPLAETLLDFGAAINGLDDDGSPLMTALAFGYIETAEALARRGARVDHILPAAALGRVDLVRAFVADGGGARSSLVAPDWLGLSSDPKAHMALAFVWACAFGRTAVVELLLDDGVDVAAKDSGGMTGLHWAAANGHLDIVTLLLARGAPLEARNAHGGTVLGSTLYFAGCYPDDIEYYLAAIETLLAAGAEVGAVGYPRGIPRIDEVLARHGASAG